MTTTGESPLADEVRKILGFSGKDRDFIADHGLKAVHRDGISGISLQVRLTSYRSLPLSCIEGMSLKIDGNQVDSNQIILTLNHYDHKLTDLKSRSGLWWFVLELATVFAPTPEPLQPGPHTVEGTLITVEPYITAGRFSFYNSSKRTLILEEPTVSEVRS